MRNAVGLALGATVAGALFFAAQPASADNQTGCPAGQAMQSSDPSGKRITCVPIPDVSGVQGQISAEAAARATADTQLQNAINAEAAARGATDGQLQNAIGAEAAARGAADTQLQNNLNAEAITRGGMDGMLLQGLQQETADRKTADDALRSTILPIETSIIGTYTFTGPVTCLNSSNGFNADFTPKQAVLGSPSTVVQLLSGMSTGTRTFVADGADNTHGTGTLQVTTLSVLPSSVFFGTSIQNGVTVFTSGVAFAGTPNPSGGASAVDQAGSFTWEITADGKLIITEDTINGTVTAGNRKDWSVVNSGTPRQVGVLGKDLRVIALTTEGLKVENTTQTSPDHTQSSSTDRICTRERLLRKL